jgi:hypothetical protein
MSIRLLLENGPNVIFGGIRSAPSSTNGQCANAVHHRFYKLYAETASNAEPLDRS